MVTQGYGQEYSCGGLDTAVLTKVTVVQWLSSQQQVCSHSLFCVQWRLLCSVITCIVLDGCHVTPSLNEVVDVQDKITYKHANSFNFVV